VDITVSKPMYMTTAPAPVAGGKVTPLLDAKEYNDALVAELAKVGKDPDPNKNKAAGDFIHIAGWWLGLRGGQWQKATKTTDPDYVASKAYPRYELTPGGTTLFDVLEAKAKAGVDVRVMAWCHFWVMLNRENAMRVEPIQQYNTLTIGSVQLLRGVPEIGGKAILNVMCHTGGAVHAKVAMVGNNAQAVGFTGGLDFVNDRWATLGHPQWETWHDVVARVEGPPVQGLYNWFADYWKENTTLAGAARDPITFKIGGLTIKHILPTTPSLPGRSFATSPAAGKHHGQVLRTIPARNYNWASIAPRPPANGFPVAGEFHLRDAWEKAIKAATDYIYMEDQAFWSQEILTWVRDRVKTAADLRVVLLTGAGSDPNDPTTNDRPFLCQSLDAGLVAGLTAGQRDRIRMFKRWGDEVEFDTGKITKLTPGATTIEVETDMTGTAANDGMKGRYFLRQGTTDVAIAGNKAVDSAPIVVTVDKATGAALAAGSVTMMKIVGIFVHAKTTLVDDHWAIIGSANCMRRSLYTDGENSVAFVDEDDLAVKEYRKRLWAHHFRHPTAADFEDVKASLHSWETSWFTAGTAPARPKRSAPGPEYLEPVNLPIATTADPCVPLTSGLELFYDRYKDPDSRDAYGYLQP